MPRRCSLHVLFPLALAAPLLVPALAQAQDASGRAPDAATATPPPAAAPAGSPSAGPAPTDSGGSAPSPGTGAAPGSGEAPRAPRPALIVPSPASAAPPAPAARAFVSPAPPPINPSRDQQALAAQGAERPSSGELGNPQEVFSEDWWGRARPVFEVHGFFRTRAELFHNLFLNRHSSSLLSGSDPQQLWPIPLDQSYTSLGVSGKAASVNLCGPATPSPNQSCYDKTESGANVRLRLDPEIHISDNLRILSEVDALDNLVLGSTPNSYAMQPATSGGMTISGNAVGVKTGYMSAGYNPYASLGFFSTTQGPPTAGVNSWTNSVEVKRVWGEYMTPVGQLRFGRMPSHWGLGMVDNGGDGIDSDYQTTVDRIMFVTGIKSMDLYFGGAWDFVSTGPTTSPGAATSPAFNVYGGQPYNNCNLCNVNEWAAFVAHRTNPELQKLQLARGDIVINGGLYTKFRSQYLDVAAGETPYTIDVSENANNNSLEARQAWALTPDVWVQTLWKKLRFEAEFAMIYGEIGNVPGLSSDVGNPVDIRQFGLATQTEYRAIDDKLDLQFGFGWASGDPWAYNQLPNQSTTPTGALNPAAGLPHEFNTYGPISTFGFHPDYRVDLIFYRNILSRVEGSYYFRPSVDYDFIRHADGEKFGGGAAIIWSRASTPIQSPGHQDDLGVELDLQLYYQSKDGSLNDDPTKIGGFYTMLQYGVFFPFGGLDYLSGQVQSGIDASLSAAQTVRLFLGIVF